ncbi:MAG: hypothetical protein ACKVPJ_05440, partial [Chitinophagales bacterium]
MTFIILNEIEYVIFAISMMKRFLYCFLLLVILCVRREILSAQNMYAIPLRTMTDAEYPDNNNIGYRSRFHNKFLHDTIIFEERPTGTYDIIITPSDSTADTAFIFNFNLLEMIPTIPACVKTDAYLSHLALLNQEWNRIQIRFTQNYFTQSGKSQEKDITTRIDIANNCLGAQLWEAQMYALESNRERVY